MPAIARWCFSHRKLVLVLWLVAFVGFFAADFAAKPAYSSKFQIPNTESTRALDILKANFPAASGEADQIVMAARHGTFSSPTIAAEAKEVLSKVAGLPGVTAVISPFSPAGKAQISKSKTIAFATIYWNAQSQDLPSTDVSRLIDTVQAAQSSNLEVELGGQAIENAQPQKSSDSTGLGVIFALIVLGFLFGAVLAAVIPIITALDCHRNWFRVHRTDVPPLRGCEFCSDPRCAHRTRRRHRLRLVHHHATSKRTAGREKHRGVGRQRRQHRWTSGLFCRPDGMHRAPRSVRPRGDLPLWPRGRRGSHRRLDDVRRADTSCRPSWAFSD